MSKHHSKRNDQLCLWQSTSLKESPFLVFGDTMPPYSSYTPMTCWRIIVCWATTVLSDTLCTFSKFFCWTNFEIVGGEEGPSVPLTFIASQGALEVMCVIDSVTRSQQDEVEDKDQEKQRRR